MASSEPETQQQPQQTPEPWKKKVLCRYFVHGACKFGSSCVYSHDRSDAQDLVCRYYQIGHCSYGDKCRYDHINLEKKRNAEAKKLGENSFSSFQYPPYSTSTNDGDWAKANEFVPGKQYSPRREASYSLATKQGLIDDVNKTDDTPQVVNPSAKSDELCPFALNGECFNGEEVCIYTHGLLCDMCGLYILHPNNQEQNKKHKEECEKYYEEDMKESFKIAKSKELACGICMEVVWDKPNEQDRKFGILENCNHVYCLSCIRQWRSAKSFNNKVVKACPECRVSSSFVTPSEDWIEDKEEKEKLISGYKEHLSKRPCKYFDQGKGKCPFGKNCFYLHAYPNGEKQDRSKIVSKTVRDSNGQTRTIDQSTIWDFIGERNTRASDLMALFNDDFDLFDLFYLLGDDSDDNDTSSDTGSFDALQMAMLQATLRDNGYTDTEDDSD